LLKITQSLCGNKTRVLSVQCCEVQQGGRSATVVIPSHRLATF